MVDMALRQREDSQVAAKLRSAGIQASSVFDLVNSGKTEPTAIPILVSSLPEVTDLWIKQGIVRALTVPEARGIANKPLLAQFLQPSIHDATGGAASLKWAIGNALAIIATDLDYPTLVDILRDPRHGKSREMVALALATARVPDAAPVLCESLSDSEIAGHCLMALNKIRAVCSLGQLEELESDKRGWVRREARQMRKRIEQGHKPRAMSSTPKDGG